MEYKLNIKIEKTNGMSGYYDVSIYVNNAKIYEYQIDDTFTFLQQNYSRDNIHSPFFENLAKFELHKKILGE